MTRDFLGVAFITFSTVVYLIFRISPMGNTPLPMPQPTSDNAGSMLVLLLLLLLLVIIVSICFTVWIAIVIGRVAFGGWRDLSRERFLLASAVALAWSWYQATNATETYTQTNTWPVGLVGALAVWGVITNTVIFYWLTGAIRRLWAGDRSSP